MSKLLWAAGIGVATMGAIVWRGAARRFPLAGVVDPLAVADLASQFPPGEGDFIRAAWHYAGTEIRYEPVGSILLFSDDSVRCQRCLLPGEVARRGRANCFGKAVLLASLLRTRLPPDLVFVAVGEVTQPDIGGHSWVVVRRQDGEWYLLEATKPPGEWRRASEFAQAYHPSVLFNDVELLCQDEQMCRQVHRSECLPCMLAG